MEVAVKLPIRKQSRGEYVLELKSLVCGLNLVKVSLKPIGGKEAAMVAGRHGGGCKAAQFTYRLALRTFRGGQLKKPPCIRTQRP